MDGDVLADRHAKREALTVTQSVSQSVESVG